MRYTQMLNQRLKAAGREYTKSREMKKTEELWEKIREIRREAEDTDSFFPWEEAAARLSWSREEEELLAVLWGLESRGSRCRNRNFCGCARSLREKKTGSFRTGISGGRKKSVCLRCCVAGWRARPRNCRRA